MKKGFSLVEMLIVVTVLVTLMAITFRLRAIGGSSSHRNTTVSRLQRLENCLSGYYAAFGTYPPVKLHGSRNYKLAVSAHA
jgi:prepilin-type N-terminal cleavage/methylation domain-containing protein